MTISSGIHIQAKGKHQIYRISPTEISVFLVSEKKRIFLSGSAAFPFFPIFHKIYAHFRNNAFGITL